MSEADARAAAEAAISQAEEHANKAWRDAAFDAVQRLAATRLYFIVDDVWPLIPQDVSTHENRAMGAVMRRAAKECLIESTYHLRSSAVRTHHANPRLLWHSLIFRGETQ